MWVNSFNTFKVFNAWTEVEFDSRFSVKLYRLLTVFFNRFNKAEANNSIINVMCRFLVIHLLFRGVIRLLGSSRLITNSPIIFIRSHTLPVWSSLLIFQHPFQLCLPISILVPPRVFSLSDHVPTPLLMVRISASYCMSCPAHSSFLDNLISVIRIIHFFQLSVFPYFLLSCDFVFCRSKNLPWYFSFLYQ